MSSGISAESFDNTEETIIKEINSFNKLLENIHKNLKIFQHKKNTLYDEFILNPLSLKFENDIKILINNNNNRYSIEKKTYSFPYENDEGETIDSLPSCMTRHRESIIIKRNAFKKLPRPIILTLFYLIILLSILSYFLYLIFKILNIKKIRV
jgi:hypothetical protein